MPSTGVDSTRDADDALDVVAGVVFNDRGDVLVNQRSHPAQFAGKWEFPGGKIESGETIVEALRRELIEEVGIKIASSTPLITVTHDYSHRRVRLHVQEVTEYTGIPRGMEGQSIRWVPWGELHDIDFLDANEPILDAVLLAHQSRGGAKAD